MTRKLEGVPLDPTLLIEQGKVKDSLKITGNVDKLGGLLEEIRDAMMEYQVCTSPNYIVLQLLMSKPEFNATRYLRQGLSAHREFRPFTPRSC